ncbi:MAG: phage major capsid protein [Candidatus Riesia sp.]|nr:phage major capsid protein [Candidatus Riesia sp.]
MDIKTIDAVKKALGQVSGELKEKLSVQNQEIKGLHETRDKTALEIKSLEERYDQVIADLTGQIEEMQKKAGRLNQLPGDELKSIGQTFVESKGYSNFKSEGWRGTTGQVFVPSSFSSELKAMTGNSSLRNVLSVERVMEIIRNPVRQIRIRDLFPVVRTNSGVIEFCREALTSTIDSTATTQTHGSAKAEAGIAFEDATVQLRTIAHYLPVNNQILEDVPALRGFIDTRLIEGLKQVEDQKLLYGTGVDPDITGVLNDSDIQTYNWSDGAVGDTYLDALRRGITLSRLAEYPVDAVVINPQDWEVIELLKGSDKHYLWVTVPEGGVPMLWRVPVIDTTAINQGDALVGSFRMGATVYDKQEANIRVSDSHASTFIENKTTILAEERLALAVFRPQSFVHVSFDDVPTS